MGSGKIHYVDVEDDNAESGNDCSYLLHFDYSDVNKITVEPIIVKPKNRRGGNSYGSGHWNSCVDNTQRDSGSIPHEVQTPPQRRSLDNLQRGGDSPSGKNKGHS